MQAFSSHSLDEMFRFTFSDRPMPRTVMMRMFYSARTGTTWIFTANPDGSPLVANHDGPVCDVRDAPYALVV